MHALLVMPQLLELYICIQYIYAITHNNVGIVILTRNIFVYYLEDSHSHQTPRKKGEKNTYIMKGVAAVMVFDVSAPYCLNGCPSVPPSLELNKNSQRCSLSKSIKSWNGTCRTVVTKTISKLSTRAALKGNTGVTGVPTSVPVRVAHELLLAGHRYLDVRTPEEFYAGHVPGAVNIPYMYKVGSGMTKNLNFVAEVASHFREEDEILIGCQLGKRSFTAASYLRTIKQCKSISKIRCFNRYGNLSPNFEEGSWKSVEGVMLCSANCVPLSPVSFLERAAKVCRDRASIVYGILTYTWEETHYRCLKVASALTKFGISRGDVVATLCPNVPAMIELHFAVPMAGAILSTLNTRLDAATVSLLLEHSGAKLIFVDYQLLEIASQAFELLERRERKLPILVSITDPDCSSVMDTKSTHCEYENLVAEGDAAFEIRRPNSEWDPISVNYTSGTTSRPKGVVYSHRGAYLNSLATALLHGMVSMPVYLWTVPLFHCNGWCLPWGVAALCGTNICLRKVSSKGIFENIAVHNVTHLGGAPAVLNMIVNSATSERRSLPHRVHVMTGGAPPTPQILFKMEELGFSVSHLYGLTETYGPGTSCLWKPEWDSLPPITRSQMKARQGVQHICLEELDVKDPVTMESVPADGKTMGEVMFRGNTVMSGYLKDVKATEEAFKGGWFRSGDLAVKHPDNYIEVKDRSKDIIISGGENISTVEVETVLYTHQAVLEAAVVGRPDDHWGQTPCAFLTLKEGFHVDALDIIKFCRDRLPHFMAPKTVVFQDIPKTSTGKVQKYLLREKAKAMGSISCANKIA